jgi:hypothetical protein
VTVEAEVREFRKAARLIMAAPKPRRERLAALIRLAERARESGSGVLAQQAVWVESKGFIRREPPPPPVQVGDPVEDAVRGLLRQGYMRCPSCLSPLSNEQELDRARQRRADEVERRRLFEEAGQ